MWIDLGVDGFRMDAPLHFEENDTEFNSETLSWLYEYCKAKNPDFYMVSEVWSSKATIASYYKSGTPSFFNFATSDMDGTILSTVRGTLSAEKLAAAFISYREDYGSNNPDYIDAPFITNHDQGRPCNMLQSDADGLKFAGGLLNTMSGNPFVYYGEELGMKSKGKKDENKRLPMMWSSDSKAEGMTKGPTDADKGIEQSFPGVDEQLNDPDSILNYYKRALRMRNENPEIARGIEEICPETSGNLALIKKTWEGSSVYIAINSNKEAADFDIHGEGDLEIVYSLTLHDTAIPFNGGVLSMPERSICVLKEKN